MLKPFLSSSQLGGWPVSSNWTSLDFNRTLRLLMSQYDHFPFFRAYLGPHPTPPHMPIIQVRDVLVKTWGDLGLPGILVYHLSGEGWEDRTNV